MPPLRNGRQEIYAQAIAKGETQIVAHAKAGYEPDDGNASRLTGNHRVKQRIREIQSAAVDLTQVTVASLVAAADELRRLAIEHKQISAGVAAIKEMGILTGLRIDRREVGAPGEFDRLSDEELMKFIDGEVLTLIQLPDDDPDEAR